jgi:hypothetical protein
MSCKDLAIFNISEKHKSFTITPQSTGSRTFCHILDNFDFHTYELCNNTLQHKSNKVIHNHTFRLFPNHEDYKLIMTGRNPYNRVVSNFKRSLESQKYINKNFNLKIDFSEFVYDLYYSYNLKELMIPEIKDINSFSFKRFFIGFYDLSVTPDGFFERKIDYKVRIDSIEDDYKSIDFINNSDYYKNGLLDLALSKKIGLMNNTVNENYNLPLPWQEYYTQETADIVYKFASNYFNTFEFEKDSWKK